MSRHFILGIGLAFVASLAACGQKTDLESERAALRATDEAFAAAASQGTDVDLIASYWADDAKVYPGGSPVLEGTQAIKAFLHEFFDTPGAHVTWTLQDVVVSASGDLGVTAGTNEFTMPGPDGSSVTSHGYYVTVWQKNADGDWKAIYDMSSSAGPEPGAEMP